LSGRCSRQDWWTSRSMTCAIPLQVAW
jgi:hypothetical protein